VGRERNRGGRLSLMIYWSAFRAVVHLQPLLHLEPLS
jgi:hypothetical protein